MKKLAITILLIAMPFIQGCAVGAIAAGVGAYKYGRAKQQEQYKDYVIEMEKLNLERVRKEKLQGVVEMAGAVCHELNQPLQALFGYSELFILNLPEGNRFKDQMQMINEQLQKMGMITRKLNEITRYETMDYLQGKIIDIDKASVIK